MEKIKRLREITGAGIMDVKNALDEANGDEKKAEEILRAKGAMVLEKKAGRATEQGLIDGYIHLGKIGVMVEVACETDFVARNEEFKNFVHELAVHISATECKDVNELLKQEYFRDASKTIEQLLSEVVSKTGENIKIKRFCKLNLGEE